jgi:hypothetical protein
VDVSYQGISRTRTDEVDRRKRTSTEISMLFIFRKLMKNDDGATAIEYVLIASLISVAAVVSKGGGRPGF